MIFQTKLCACNGFSRKAKRFHFKYLLSDSWKNLTSQDFISCKTILIPFPRTVGIILKSQFRTWKIFLFEFLSPAAHEKCELKPQKNDKSRYESHLNKPADVIYENFGLKRERIIEVKSLSGEIIGSR